jgi:tetratricopeptide (TPR) repeat protein
VAALERLAADRLTEEVERLAYHARRGEVWDKALHYGRRAGAKAMTRSAHQETVTYFEQALDAVSHLPEGPDTVGQGIDVRLEFRNALLHLGDDARIYALLRDAERLAEALDDPYRLGWVAAHLTHYFWRLRHLDRALEYGQRAVALAAPLRDLGLYALAHFDLAEVHYSLGNYRQAIVAFEQLVARFTGDRLYERIAGSVFSVVSHRWLVQALAETGAFAEGIVRGEEGIRIAETADHPFSLVNICLGVGYLYLCKGDFQQAIPFLARSLELCRVWNIRLMVTGCALHCGHALALSGQVRESLALLEQSVETAELTRALGRSAMNAAYLSEIYWLAGMQTHRHWRRKHTRLLRRRRNAAVRRGPHDSSARCTPRAMRRMSSRPKPTTARPSPWPRSWACARSRRTATGASARCMPRCASGNRPALH